MARARGIDAFVIPHHGQSGAFGNRTLADAMEAIVGAAWEDAHNFHTVTAVMQALGII